MGPNINYIRRSTHANHGVAKNKLEERRERQQLAQQRMEEAIRRAVRSTTGVDTFLPSTHLLATAATGKQWAFSHARREGGRIMGAAAPACRSALTISACDTVAREEIEQKKHQLLATADWASLSRSNGPASGSRFTALVRDGMKLEPPEPPGEENDRQASPSEIGLYNIPKVEHATEVQMRADTKDDLHRDSSSVDINMPSSPPGPDSTLSSYVQSNLTSSRSLRNSLPVDREEEEVDVKPTPETILAVASRQGSVAAQDNFTEFSAKAEAAVGYPYSYSPLVESTPGPLTVLQHLGTPFSQVRHVKDLDCKPLVCSFLLPCMLGECDPPLVYDGIPRSKDYLRMTFTVPMKYSSEGAESH